jgi:hypothetical protein
LILIILLLAGGIIYATFASNPTSFDDLIELRFLPSRRRHRDPEYFEKLKSMILPREVSHRVTSDESEPEHNTFEIAAGQAEFEKEQSADTPSPGTVLKPSVIDVSYSDNQPSGLS